MSDTRALYSLLLGPGPTSFLSTFEARWKDHLETLPQNYRAGKQLRIGSRLRPLLVAWGYLLAGNSLNETNRAELADLAIYIELLHKATLLVDDVLDQDQARRGEEAFHIQFSEEEAILLAVYLVGQCIEKLSASTNDSSPERLCHHVVELLGASLREMALGGIKETTLSNHELPTVEEVKKIIELQTIAIIKNGLLTGYRYGHGRADHEDLIDNIGFDCGYIFQVLNDLEPFLDKEQNALHKGTTNFDFIRSRKNIAAALVFERLNTPERGLLRQLRQTDSQALAERVSDWFDKYEVLETIIDDLKLVNANIYSNIAYLPLPPGYRDEFESFVDTVLKVAIKRLGASHYERLSKILIR